MFMFGCGDSSGPAQDISSGDDSGKYSPLNEVVPEDEKGTSQDILEVGETAEPGDVVQDRQEPAENQPPSFAELNVVTLDMGTGTTLDLNPFIDDAEDSDEELVLDWSAFDVALEDKGDHLLLVVAPTDWFGTEVITITVTDTGGLEASADLKVMVTEVETPDPVPPDKCGETLFSYENAEAGEVLLSGSFNEWGDDKDSADAMEDPDDDGVWEVTLELEPGAYQYKFVVDGEWIPDPKNSNKVSDGYGSFNSVVEVPECVEEE